MHDHTKPVFSGPNSHRMWNEINALPHGPVQSALYGLGCELQRFEMRVEDMVEGVQQELKQVLDHFTPGPTDAHGRAEILLDEVTDMLRMAKDMLATVKEVAGNTPEPSDA